MINLLIPSLPNTCKYIIQYIPLYIAGFTVLFTLCPHIRFKCIKTISVLYESINKAGRMIIMLSIYSVDVNVLLLMCVPRCRASVRCYVL